MYHLYTAAVQCMSALPNTLHVVFTDPALDKESVWY